MTNEEIKRLADEKLAAGWSLEEVDAWIENQLWDTPENDQRRWEARDDKKDAERIRDRERIGAGPGES